MPADAMRKAQELLDSGTLSPEKAEQLRAKMQKYEQKAGKSYALGDPRAPTGLAAIESVEEKTPRPEAQQKAIKSYEQQNKPRRMNRATEERETADKVRMQEWVREGQAPKKHSQEQYLESVLEEQAGEALDPIGSLYASADAIEAKVAESQSRSAIKNLSKDPALFVPPEYRSSKSQMDPMADAVPFVNHKVWYEPSVEQFRRDMGGALSGAGVDPEKVTEEDPVYKRYADAMWAQAYKEAAAADQSLVRHSQIDDKEDYGAKAVLGGVPHILGGIMGLGTGYSGGAFQEIAGTALHHLTSSPADAAKGTMFEGDVGTPPDIQQTMVDLRNAEEGSPMGAVGAVAGSLLPGGMFGSGLSKAAGLIPGASGGITRGMGIGALAGGGASLATDSIRNLGDLSRGADPTVSLEQMGSNALAGLGAGAAFGGLGGGIANLAQRGKGALLKSSVGKDLQLMEDAGIEPGLFRHSEPANVKAARSRTAAAGLGNDVRSQASNELSQPVARAWRDMEEFGVEGELPAIKHQVDEYFRSKEGTATRVPLTNTANSVIELLESRKTDAGEALPFINTRQFEEIRDQLFDTKVVTRAEADALKQAGWRPLPIDGGDADKVWVGRARELNAREMTEVIDKLDDLAGFSGKELTGPKEQAWKRFSAAVRKDRDQFEENRWTKGPGGGQLQVTLPDGSTATGFSALMARLSDAKRQASKVTSAAGLSGAAPGVKARIREKIPTPHGLDEVRDTDLSIDQLDELGADKQFDDVFYSPVASGKSSPASARRRQQLAEHHKYIAEQVVPAMDDFPRGITAIKMFSLGFDDPIRMVQRGMSPEQATRLYKPELAEHSPQELARLVKLAAEHIEEAIDRAPKATHVPTVFRGIALDEHQIQRILEDGHFHNGGMTSSFSRNPVMAETFGFKGGTSTVPTLLKVKHKNGVGIETLSKAGMGEYEVLLPGKSSFKVTDAYWLKQRGPKGGLSRTLVIEADEVGESLVGKVPKRRSAVREGLAMEPNERQSKEIDRAIHGFRQNPGGARGDEAMRKILRAAGVEEEAKMWAGILAAQRAGTREGVAASGSGVRGWLSGGLFELAMRGTKTLNRLRAEPLSMAPKPSEELRALLRRLVPTISGADPVRGPSPFQFLGLGSGGGSAYSMALPSESNQMLLDPELHGAVMGDLPAAALVRGDEALSPKEQGVLERIAEAFGRGVGQNIQVPAPKVVEPQGAEQEFE